MKVIGGLARIGMPSWVPGQRVAWLAQACVILEAVVSDACSQFARFLEIRRSEIDVADVNLAAFVVVTTIEALSHSAVLSRPDFIASERADAFLDETTRLVLGFLRPSKRGETAPQAFNGAA